MTHGRLPGLTPGQLSAEQRQVYERITGGQRAAGPQSFALVDDAGALAGPFNAMLLNPRIGTCLQELGGAVRYGSSLPDRLREMAILAVAAHWHSAFERYAHEAVGRGIGLTGADLADLRAGRTPASSSERESLALRVVEALLRRGDLDGEEYLAADGGLGAAALFEVTTLVGYYALLALQLRVYRVPAPAGSAALDTSSADVDT